MQFEGAQRMNPVDLAHVRRTGFARGEFHGVAADSVHSVAEAHQDMPGRCCIAGCYKKIEIDLPTQRAVRNRFRRECDSFEQRKRDALPAQGAADCGRFLQERSGLLAILSEILLESIQDGLRQASFHAELGEPIEQVKRQAADIQPIEDPLPVARAEYGEARFHLGGCAAEARQHGFLQSPGAGRRFGFEPKHWVHVDQWLYISGSPRLPAGGRWRR